MKLKEALELYDIIVTEPNRTPPEGGICVERQYNYGKKKMWNDGVWRAPKIRFEDEETAVAWLIEGATPLSPMERACKKWPIKVNTGNRLQVYSLGDKGVFKADSGDWLNLAGLDMTTYTESEAVAYLLEGYKPKMPDVKVILNMWMLKKTKRSQA